MSEIKDRLPLLFEAFNTAAFTGRLSDQDWQALDRRLQVAVFEAVAGRPPPPHGVPRGELHSRMLSKTHRLRLADAS
jgi:hypothetical protein